MHHVLVLINMNALSYRIDRPQVIDENFDGEVIVVNLTLGNYFSLQGTAAEAWQRIAAGETSAAISADWQARFGVDAQADLSAFLNRLVEEQLLAEGPGEPEGQATFRAAAYAAPAAEKYTDMQELLLLDPIHDVDPMGWPAKQ